MALLNQIIPAQLMRQIGLPDAPSIIDVRIAEDLAADPKVIATTQLLQHTACLHAPETLHGKRVVVVCQKGKKLSEGVAALLRAQGIQAENLEGGSMAWVAAGLTMTALTALPKTNLWVTRRRPKIDRIACPWLIRRFVDPSAQFLFVDPSAQFLFVAPAEVADVADRFNATPFDNEGSHFSHRGQECSFDTMLGEFSLQTEPLQRLATVVRAADSDRHDLSPQAAGLLAISVGLSRQYRDDLQQLEADMQIYDALYRWARDGQDEGHDWPAGRNQ